MGMDIIKDQLGEAIVIENEGVDRFEMILVVLGTLASK